jgi:mRNA interferase MazF
MVINQGDIVWVDLGGRRGSSPAGRRPAVVLQHDRFTASGIATIVVATITSKRRYADLPGNVALRRGEAGLAKPSVVNVTQIAAVDRGDIVATAGRVSRTRMLEIWEGVRLVLEP